MSPLVFFKGNRILAFAVGLLFFVILVPRFFALSDFAQMPSKAVIAKTATAIAKQSKSTSSLGINLAGVDDVSTELALLDAFKSARKWITQCEGTDPGCNHDGEWDTNEFHLLDLDKNGWVKSLPTPQASPKYTEVRTIMNTTDRAPGGRYIVLYDGEGNIDYQFNIQKDRAASVTGRDVIDVTPSSDGIQLIITSTDPKHTGNYIRNIRVVKAEYEKSFKTEIFNPAFINKIKKFKTLRFMDWMETNNSLQKEWVNRPKLDTASYNSVGVPIETMVALANKLKVEPWFNMAHMSTDEYITNFARMVKASLDPNLKIYVEYSNEIWNTIFDQGSWVEQQGTNEWSSSSESDYTKRINWYGKRTAQMCSLWKREFGNQKQRVVCVLGSQAANSWTAETALDCPLWQQGSCSNYGIDAVAIAPYFGAYLGNPNYQNQVQTWTLNQLFQEINQGGILKDGPVGGAIKQASDWITDNFTLTSQRQLNLVAYEGGQHLVGISGVENNDAITNLFIAANRDQRMYDVYANYLKKWQKAGGSLFMAFSDIVKPTKWGSWGVLEYVTQNGSPKYNALVNFIDKNPS